MPRIRTRKSPPPPQAMGAAEQAVRAALRRNSSESVIAWLFSRGLLTERQLAAGEQLRADFTRAGLMAVVTMQWDAPAPDGSPRAARSHDAATVASIDAKRRFDAAMAHVGNGLADVCWRVICAGDGMVVTERALGWPTRSGRIILGLALDRLAAFYRC